MAVPPVGNQGFGSLPEMASWLFSGTQAPLGSSFGGGIYGRYVNDVHDFHKVRISIQSQDQSMNGINILAHSPAEVSLALVSDWEERRGNLGDVASAVGDGMRSLGCEILEEIEDHLDEIGYIFAQNDAMALGAVDYLHSHGRKPGKDVLICAFGGGAELRALQKKGEVAVIGALDDTQLAELTADAAQQIAKAPWKPYIALADTAVLTEEETADA